MNCNIQSHLPSVQYCGARFLLWLHNIHKFSTFANLYFCIKIQFQLLNLQFTHCLHSFTHCLWDAHSFVGARGQVRPTGVSGGECQGHQQSLTPLSKPQIPLSKPPTPKPHQTSHPLMYDVFYHRAAKTMQMCQCVSISSPNVPTAPQQCFWLVLFCYHISTTQVSKYWSFPKNASYAYCIFWNDVSVIWQLLNVPFVNSDHDVHNPALCHAFFSRKWRLVVVTKNICPVGWNLANIIMIINSCQSFMCFDDICLSRGLPVFFTRHLPS